MTHKARQTTPDKNYEKSNKITTLSFSRISRDVKQLAQQIIDAKDAATRQKLAQEYVEQLSRKARIPVPKVRVVNRRRPHSTGRFSSRVKRETHGHYQRGSMLITIYNLTAVRGNVVAGKTFLETLHHEWMHHYDYFKLKLSKSIHCSGFYKRLGHLKQMVCS